MASFIQGALGGGTEIDVNYRKRSHHNRKRYTLICGCGNNQAVTEIKEDQVDSPPPPEFKDIEDVIMEIHDINSKIGKRAKDIVDTNDQLILHAKENIEQSRLIREHVRSFHTCT